MPWTLSSLLTMSTTRSGSAVSSPPTGQNVPPSRKASMQSRMSAGAPVYSTAASTPSPRVASRIILVAASPLPTTTIPAPSRLSPFSLLSCRVAAITVAPASLASRMVAVPMPPDAPGDEDRVVDLQLEPVGDDAMGGSAGPHGGGALVGIEIGRGLDPIALGTGDELRVAAEHGVAGKIDAAGEIAQPAHAGERVRVLGIGHAEHAVARRERRHVLALRCDLAGDIAPELRGHRKGAAAVDAAVVSRRLAVEFVHLAAAILDVPA